VAINVMGRIGQETLKLLLDTPKMELAAVNDIGSHDGKNGKEQSR
jgi:glyceraldehyde-3-phosphate dehydrogenase/erythrose-4-phosphate dehydrogenase